MNKQNKNSKNLSKHVLKRNANCEEILKIIEDFTHTHGYGPTIRDILDKSHLKSVSSVHSYIVDLENKDLVIRENNKSRSIKLVKDSLPSSTVTLPLIGSVAAGYPILAVQNISEYVSLPSSIACDGSFVLEVKGNSMKDAGILNGDKIIVKRQSTALNGQIVVALIDEEATVKRFYKEPKKIILRPENAAYNPIILDEVSIEGVVVGVYRTY